MKRILPNKLLFVKNVKCYTGALKPSYLPRLTKISIHPAAILWSFITNSLALFCLLLFIVLTSSNVRKTVSPVFASLSSFGSFAAVKPQNHVTIQNRFSFVPGYAPNKFNSINYDGLQMLSFYDVPVNADGTLDTDTEGYANFHSDESAALFQTARQKGVKMLLTLSQTYDNDVTSFLDNPDAQYELYKQTAQEIIDTGIDGITIDIELDGKLHTDYRDKYTTFVKGFTDYMHNNIRGSVVVVALPDDATQNSFYDIKNLSAVSDTTFIMAYNIAAPEVENAQTISPVYGGNDKSYKDSLQKVEDSFLSTVSPDKLAIEKAWYGNGNNYPLFASNDTSSQNDIIVGVQDFSLTQNTTNRLISDVPLPAQEAARKNLPYIVDALRKEGILNVNVLAYALATIQHETAATFEPIDEYKGRKSARRLGYEGGTNYFGRGFIQLTHLRNYKKMGERIGMNDELAKHPELASRPDIAARVLAAYFKDYGISKLATQGNFVDARTLINPDYNGYTIAEIALNFLYEMT